MLYFKPFIFSFLASCALMPLVYWAAIKFFKWPRKKLDIHHGAKPRLGGVALIFVFWLAIFLNKNLVITRPLWGVFIASIVILIYGLWDDFKGLNPKIQLTIQILVGLIIIGAGVSVNYIKNPFGGTIRFDVLRLAIGNWQFAVLGGLFIIAWTVLVMNVMNWLDGLDGLAGGVSLIGFAVIFILSISPIVNQPPLGILAAILGGSLIGFLIFNFPRRRGSLIFLGTSGSIFLGFMLASLSIFSGSKVATAFLVLGIAVLDAFWVIWQRLRSKTPIWQGDQRHLHHQLLRMGLSQRQILFLYLAASIGFGILALISGTQGKILAFFSLCAIMVLLIYGVRSYKNRRQTV